MEPGGLMPHLQGNLPNAKYTVNGWSMPPKPILIFSYNLFAYGVILDKSMFERILYEVDKSEIPL